MFSVPPAPISGAWAASACWLWVMALSSEAEHRKSEQRAQDSFLMGSRGRPLGTLGEQLIWGLGLQSSESVWGYFLPPFVSKFTGGTCC